MAAPQFSDLITAVFDCMKETKPYGSLSQCHGVNFNLRRSRSAICCLLSVHGTGQRVLLVECVLSPLSHVETGCADIDVRDSSESTCHRGKT